MNISRDIFYFYIIYIVIFLYYYLFRHMTYIKYEISREMFSFYNDFIFI